MTLKLPILIVNDDPVIYDILVRLATENNFRYRSVTTAKDALAEADRYDFSLAFIDLSLDDMAGDEFYKQLLEKESHYTLPIVSFIDSSDSVEIEALNNLHPQGRITLFSKPLDEKRVLEMMERYGDKNPQA